MIPLEVGIPHRLFGQARARDVSPLYEVITAALRSRVVRTDADFTLQIANGPERLAESDTVVIPASDEDYGLPTQGRLGPDLEDAFALIRPDTPYAPICTGRSCWRPRGSSTAAGPQRTDARPPTSAGCSRTSSLIRTCSTPTATMC